MDKDMDTAEKEVPEIMRSDFGSCFDHFTYRLSSVRKGTSQAALVKTPVAEFCGCTINTVGRWVRGQTPMGEIYFRAMCLLDAVGYRVIELERMKPEPRGLLELIGYRVVSANDLAQAVKYSGTEALYAAIRSPHPDDQTRTKMFDAIVPRKEVLEASRKKAVEHLTKTAMYKVLIKTSRARPDPHEQTDAFGLPSRPGLLSIVEGLHALLAEVSDKAILDEMANSKLDRELILELSARLATISSMAAKDERFKPL